MTLNLDMEEENDQELNNLDNQIIEEIWMFKVTSYPNGEFYISKPWSHSKRLKEKQSRKKITIPEVKEVEEESI